MKSLKISAWCLTALALPALAIAQQKARPDPADSAASVPPVIYVSPFRQYAPLGDDQVTSWKAANDLVEKIGGWQVYAREAQAPAPAADQSARPVQPSAPPAKPPTQGGHSGHQMK